jgi:uncharacterized protein
MEDQQLINRTALYVQETLKNAEAGHDWWHIRRVWKTAIHIAAHEKADQLVVELGALLHDIADSKFHNGNEDIGPETARAFLLKEGVHAEIIDHVENIIRHISFKGGHQTGKFKSVELDIVQDADRLDAMGAIGIARAFHYGGFKNRPIYDPAVPPNLQKSKEAYKHAADPTINHFYEKLFLLKDRMNTRTGAEMALSRHQFMESFINQFYQEWEGER